MSNMSYCRFENTADDLEDCVENWELDEDAREEEIEARDRIYWLAKDIVKKGEQ
jgi:hypothetical protein